MDIQTEEIVADFLATYGREVFALADELIRGIVGMAMWPTFTLRFASYV